MKPAYETVEYRTLLLLAVAIGRQHGVGSQQWNRFGREAEAKIGTHVWQLKYHATSIVNQFAAK